MKILRGRSVLAAFPYAVSGLLALFLVPLLKYFNLPLRFDWRGLSTAYWIGLAAQSIFVATLLWAIGFPVNETWRPLKQRYTARHSLLIALFFLILGWMAGWGKAAILTVDTISVLEFRQRAGPTATRRALTILATAAYLFGGFLLVFAYNDIILSARFFGAADSAFNSMDRWLLHGNTVSDLCIWAVGVSPPFFFRFLEWVYFGMFPQIGAALILCSAYYGRDRGLQFVSTILTAYYLALLLFYLFPSQGPYYLRPIVPDFPPGLRASALQQGSLANSRALWNHHPIRCISTDYYIAFPCMHIAQPLIVLWFLRRWKGMVLALIAYDVLLCAAIILLRWHYIVDLFGGVAVAALAIVIVGRTSGLKLGREEDAALRESLPS
jgi:hypothetical protein